MAWLNALIVGGNSVTIAFDRDQEFVVFDDAFLPTRLQRVAFVPFKLIVAARSATAAIKYK